jgi:glycosyltransferase involved in cell wall biosynthesis
MKILYLVNSVAGGGGLQKIILQKTNYMIEHWGYDVHIVCGRPTNEKIYDANLKINIHYIGKKNQKPLTPNSFVRLIKHLSFIKQLNPDFVMVCNNKLEDFLIPLFTKKKTIKEIHGSYQSLIHGYWHLMGVRTGLRALKANLMSFHKRFVYPRLLSQFDYAVFLTKEDKRLWNVKNGIVINNFVEATPSVNVQQEKLYFAIGVGRLEFNKGFAELIKAWAKVVAKKPELKLKIWGDGTQKDYLQSLITKLKLSSNVELSGYTSTINEEYPKASILVNTSFSEGFPLISVEAQACGLPVVSYDSPNGISEIVNHGKDGLICPVGDIDGFVSNVLRLAEDEKLLNEMSRNATENVKRFDKDRIMQQWKDLLK